MTHISEHYTEEEWESNTCENTGINFFISWNTIGVNDFLENCSKFIDSEQARRSDSMLIDYFESRNLYVLIFFFDAFNILKDFLSVHFRDPAKS